MLDKDDDDDDKIDKNDEMMMSWRRIMWMMT